MLQLIIASILSTSAAFAAPKELSPKDIRERLEIHADIYVMDQTGRKIVAGPLRTNYWKPRPDEATFKGDWSSDGMDLGGAIAFRYSWDVTADGTIKAILEEYNKSKDPDHPELGDSIERKEFVLEKLEPIVWKVKNIKAHNVIVRFIPSLREVSRPIALDSLPIAGTGISISDNAGFLWAEGIQFNGKYSGVTSHRGTLALSYLPFAGAKEMGFAEGNQITINVDKKYQINLKGATSFLPAGVTAKVYAVYLPEKKSKGFNSLHSFDTNTKSRIEEVLKK